MLQRSTPPAMRYSAGLADDSSTDRVPIVAVVGVGLAGDATGAFNGDGPGDAGNGISPGAGAGILGTACALVVLFMRRPSSRPILFTWITFSSQKTPARHREKGHDTTHSVPRAVLHLHPWLSRSQNWRLWSWGSLTPRQRSVPGDRREKSWLACNRRPCGSRIRIARHGHATRNSISGLGTPTSE